MAVAEENWQTALSTITRRTTFIFNNELLSDVRFVVPVSTEQGGINMAIPAHKFVLAISSPVFFAMFYGQMAETKDSIQLPYTRKKIYQPSPDVTNILVVFPQIR